VACSRGAVARSEWVLTRQLASGAACSNADRARRCVPRSESYIALSWCFSVQSSCRCKMGACAAINRYDVAVPQLLTALSPVARRSAFASHTLHPPSLLGGKAAVAAAAEPSGRSRSHEERVRFK
jgi:hypothetical protein